MRYLFLLSFLFILTSCAEGPSKPDAKPDLVLQTASFSALPGWQSDNLTTFVPAFEKSCARIARANPEKKFGLLERAGTYQQWQGACAKFAALPQKNTPAIRAFLQQNFDVWQATAEGKKEGLFTGYYEASLKGSRVKTERYRYPLYTRPNDLVMVQLGEFREELKGQRIAGRVINGSLKPYESREEIVSGAWPHNDKVLVWVDDAVDAFFVQIQGSGVIEMTDGGVMRIGYAGQNGHPYYAIGRELIKREHLTKDNVSMQSIREWLAANPDEADEIMNTNKSYVFFTENEKGATGGEGVVLTAGRSLAIDRSIIPYGMPVWLDAASPLPEDAFVPTRIQKLMMAQDTGGAIRGPVRGDVYWGYGAAAEKIAGPMKSKGQYWFFLPKAAN